MVAQCQDSGMSFAIFTDELQIHWTEQYSRIALTRFTACYFFIALAHCLVQISLQASTLTSNSEGIQLASAILAESKIPQGFPIIQDKTLQLCDSIPGQPGTQCLIISGQQTENIVFNTSRIVVDSVEPDFQVRSL